jgi:hypothetical protein
MNKYQNVLHIDRYVAEEIFASNDIEKITTALVSIAFYEEDWKWAQDKCLEYLSNENDAICGLAATCLGHIARVHGKMKKEKVRMQLLDRKNNLAIVGRIEDALDDIEMFVK